MAGADSTIRVNIVGDAKSLTKAADKASGAFGGMGKTAVKVGAVIGGAFAVNALVDFGAEALNQADRVADAGGRIESQLGDLSQPLIDAADGFTKLGLSKGDMLELEAKVIDVGTALGITDQQLADMAPDAASTAAALALIGQGDTEGNIALIGKAAGGSAKALKELGIILDPVAVETAALALAGKEAGDKLTEEELAAGRLHVILGELYPRIKETVEGEGDFESKTAEVNAKIENLQATIGEKLLPVMAGLLDFILRGIEGWELFAHWVGQNEQALRDLLGPIARVADALAGIIDQFAFLGDLTADVLGGPVPSEFGTGTLFSSPKAPVSGGAPGANYNINVQGGSPETIERAVYDAARRLARHGG